MAFGGCCKACFEGGESLASGEDGKAILSVGGGALGSHWSGEWKAEIYLVKELGEKDVGRERRRIVERVNKTTVKTNCKVLQSTP